MYKYPYSVDTEPKASPETREDKFIKISKRVMNIAFAIFGIALLVLLVIGIAVKYSNGML